MQVSLDPNVFQRRYLVHPLLPPPAKAAANIMIAWSGGARSEYALNDAECKLSAARPHKSTRQSQTSRTPKLSLRLAWSNNDERPLKRFNGIVQTHENRPIDVYVFPRSFC
jgi:hypothetical protein